MPPTSSNQMINLKKTDLPNSPGGDCHPPPYLGGDGRLYPAYNEEMATQQPI